MLEPDCFLLYRMCCNAEFYYVGEIPPVGIGRPSLQQGMVKVVLFTTSREHNFVGGTCALPSALLGTIGPPQGPDVRCLLMSAHASVVHPVVVSQKLSKTDS